MMFLVETNMITVIKKQCRYKFKAYSGLLFSLMLVQLIALFFSFNGVINMSSSSGGVHINTKTFSSDIVIAFTFLWMFIIAFLFTAEKYSNNDFTFISNRLSSNISNMVFLFTACFLGSITSVLNGSLFRVIHYYHKSGSIISDSNFFIPFDIMVTTILVTIMYGFVIMSAGYFFGVLIKINKLVIILLPALVFGLAILETRGVTNIYILRSLVFFFVNESSLGIFFIKTMVASIILSLLSIQLSNKLEVRI